MSTALDITHDMHVFKTNLTIVWAKKQNNVKELSQHQHTEYSPKADSTCSCCWVIDSRKTADTASKNAKRTRRCSNSKWPRKQNFKIPCVATCLKSWLFIPAVDLNMLRPTGLHPKPLGTRMVFRRALASASSLDSSWYGGQARLTLGFGRFDAPGTDVTRGTKRLPRFTSSFWTLAGSSPGDKTCIISKFTFT